MQKRHTVTIYTSGTEYCALTRDYLRQQGIDFEEIDISKNAHRSGEVESKTGQKNTPVVIIDGRSIIGYHPDLFTMLLDTKAEGQNDGSEQSGSLE